MLISYNWLCELTGTKLTPQDAGDRLTNVGLAVDKVEVRGDDSVLDVEVASNRPDCLSHVGVARELAVIEKSQVSSPTSQAPKTQGKAAEFSAVEIRDPDLCPRYAVRVVRGFGFRQKLTALDIALEHHLEQAFRPVRRFLCETADAPAWRDRD